MSDPHADPGSGLADSLALADWRRRVGELYAEVRRLATADPELAWNRWRAERESLFRRHPQSPVPAPERAAFRARHWPYDPALRFTVTLEPPTTPPVASGGTLSMPGSGADLPSFGRLGRVTLPLPGGPGSLAVYRLLDYAGGLFLPFRDPTNGTTTYGAGRYLLDTAKGADLGGAADEGALLVDLNFAYHPSCAFDPRWSCPLAPPENRLEAPVEAGERLR